MHMFAGSFPLSPWHLFFLSHSRFLSRLVLWRGIRSFIQQLEGDSLTALIYCSVQTGLRLSLPSPQPAAVIKAQQP